MTRPFEAVVCTDTAHMNVDECGAPERLAGVKLLTVVDRPRQAQPRRPRPLGGQARRRAPRPAAPRLDHPVDRARHRLHRGRDRGDRRRRPRARHVPARRRRPARQRRRGARRLVRGADHRGRRRRRLLRRHEERARLRRGGRRSATPSSARDFAFTRKQLGQLASKMRFVSAQFEALLAGDLWLRSARHANEMAARLAEAVAGIDGLEVSTRSRRTPSSPACRGRRSSACSPSFPPSTRSTSGTRRATRSAGCAPGTPSEADVDAFAARVREAVAAA